MTPFNFKSNSDNVFLRSLIVAFINTLNDRIKYDVILSQTESKTFTLPFYYSIVGDGRFIQDNFINSDNCKFDFADGNFDPIPRGVISISGISVDESALTNNFVRMEYQKLVDGQMKTFSARGFGIPLRVTFSVNIMVDIILDYFRIFQVAFSEFFKSIPFSFRYQTFRIPARAMFPAPLPGQKTYELSPGSDQRIRMDFTVEVETYLPVIDKTTEFFKGNSIHTFSSSTEMYRARPQAETSDPVLSVATSAIFGSMSLVFDGYYEPNYFSPSQKINVYSLSGKTFEVMISGTASKEGNTLTVPVFDSNDLYDAVARGIADYRIGITSTLQPFQTYKYVAGGESEIVNGAVCFSTEVPGVAEVPNSGITANTLEQVTHIYMSGKDFNQNNLSEWFLGAYMSEERFDRQITLRNRTRGSSATYKATKVSYFMVNPTEVDYVDLEVEYMSGDGKYIDDDILTIHYTSDEAFDDIVLDFWSNMPIDDFMEMNVRIFKEADSKTINRG